MAKNKNVILTLGLQLDKWGNPSPELKQRVDKAVELFRQGVGSHLVMSGSHSFSARTVPSRTEASVMTRRAVRAGIPPDLIVEEARALDTIGSAVLTKRLIAEYFGSQQNIIVVTTKSHMPRTLSIFRYVMGERHQVGGISSDESHRPRPSSYEADALLTARAIFAGTTIGDHEAIWSSLVRHIPAYAGTIATSPTAGLAQAA